MDLDLFWAHILSLFNFRAPGGELFDYLTQMVKLSEKKTRYIVSKSIINMPIVD